MLAREVHSPVPGTLRYYLVAAAISSALYGGTFGIWRSETQGLFTAVKFPLVILLTCGGNALLNALLGLVLGSGLGVRQSTVLIVMSFAVMGIILAALAPVLLFVCWNVPGPDSPHHALGSSLTILIHVGAIAFAGYVGNVRLGDLLGQLTGSRSRARVILLSWLAGNLLLGSQVSWILRPWIGARHAELSFFSPEPLRGNFFEAVGSAATTVLFNPTKPETQPEKPNDQP